MNIKRKDRMVGINPEAILKKARAAFETISNPLYVSKKAENSIEIGFFSKKALKEAQKVAACFAMSDIQVLNRALTSKEVKSSVRVDLNSLETLKYVGLFKKAEISNEDKQKLMKHLFKKDKLSSNEKKVMKFYVTQNPSCFERICSTQTPFIVHIENQEFFKKLCVRAIEKEPSTASAIAAYANKYNPELYNQLNHACLRPDAKYLIFKQGIPSNQGLSVKTVKAEIKRGNVLAIKDLAPTIKPKKREKLYAHALNKFSYTQISVKTDEVPRGKYTGICEDIYAEMMNYYGHADYIPKALQRCAIQKGMVLHADPSLIPVNKLAKALMFPISFIAKKLSPREFRDRLFNEQVRKMRWYAHQEKYGASMNISAVSDKNWKHHPELLAQVLKKQSLNPEKLVTLDSLDECAALKNAMGIKDASALQNNIVNCLPQHLQSVYKQKVLRHLLQCHTLSESQQAYLFKTLSKEPDCLNNLLYTAKAEQMPHLNNPFFQKMFVSIIKSNPKRAMELANFAYHVNPALYQCLDTYRFAPKIKNQVFKVRLQPGETMSLNAVNKEIKRGNTLAIQYLDRTVNSAARDHLFKKALERFSIGNRMRYWTHSEVPRISFTKGTEEVYEAVAKFFTNTRFVPTFLQIIALQKGLHLHVNPDDVPTKTSSKLSRAILLPLKVVLAPVKTVLKEITPKEIKERVLNKQVAALMKVAKSTKGMLISAISAKTAQNHPKLVSKAIAQHLISQAENGLFDPNELNELQNINVLKDILLSPELSKRKKFPTQNDVFQVISPQKQKALLRRFQGDLGHLIPFYDQEQSY